MTRLAWLGGIGGIIAIALLIAFRGEAAASGGEPSCTQVDGFVHFCLNVPTGAPRRETTVPLVSLPALRADVRAEVSVPGSDAAVLAASVDRSVERVETLFGRPFTARPRVLLFGTNGTFARGTTAGIGWSGLVDVLTRIGDGASFEAAYVEVAGESAATLEQRVHAAASAPAIVASAVDASGTVRWTLMTAPYAEVHVAIAG